MAGLADAKVRMDLKRIFTFALVVIAVSVGVYFLPELNDRWQDQLNRSQDPEAADLLNDVQRTSLLLHGENSASFNRDTRTVSQTIQFNCFRFKNSSKCDPAKTRLRSIIDHWNQRIDNEPAPTR